MLAAAAETDRHAQMQLYARHGVPWYWIVDPEARVVEVYRLVEGGYAPSSLVGTGEPLSAEPIADLTIAPGSLWA